MPILRVICPECEAGLKSATGFTPGQKVRCPKCETRFAVEEPEEEPLPARKPVKVAVVEDEGGDEEEDRPRKPKKKKKKKRIRDDDDEGRSYKSSPVRFIILGVLVIALGVLGYMLYEKRKKEREDAKKPDPAQTEDDLGKPINRDNLKPVQKKDSFLPPKAGVNSQNNLKQLGLGIHNWATQNDNQFPPAAISANGKPLLSWRVAILPYIGQKALFDQFKLDEPWDGPNNLKLLDKMPVTFESSVSGAPLGHTFFKVFSGGGAAFDQAKSANVIGITDGTSQTIMIIESGPAVSWSKPEDIPFSAGSAPKLTMPGGVNTLNVLMCDISLKRADFAKLKAETIKALITANGQDMPGDDWK